MTDQGSEGLLSSYLRKKRMEAVKPYLLGYVLDVGCGTGLLSLYVEADRYIGIDKDQYSLDVAIYNFPKHQFISVFPDTEIKFDTIVALAVIEHITYPEVFLKELAQRLRNNNSCILCTTPHPYTSWIHKIGANLGFFSKHANDEHNQLLNRTDFIALSKKTNLFIAYYKRFLFGMNQLIILKKS